MNLGKAIVTFLASASASTLMVQQGEPELSAPLSDALSLVSAATPADIGLVVGSGVRRPLEGPLVENLPDASSPLERAYLEYTRQFALTLGSVGIYSANQWLWDDDFTGADRATTRSFDELSLGNQLCYEEYARNDDRWGNTFETVKAFKDFNADDAYELYTRAVFMAELNAWQEYASQWDLNV